MKILIIRTHGTVVDLNTYNSQDVGMAKAMMAKGNQCDIVYFGGMSSTHIQKIKIAEGEVLIYWVKGVSIALNGIFFGLNNIIKNYDVIQVGDYDQLTSIWLMFFSKHKSKVVLYHGPYLCEFNKKYRFKSRVVDLLPLSKKIKQKIPCFAKSKFAEKFLRDRGFCNVTTVGVGLDKDRFVNNGVMERQTKKIIDFASQSKTLLYVGRVEKRRNTLFLLKVFNKVKEHHPDIRMVIIGNGEEDYKNQCVNFINEHNLKNNILYLNKLDQKQIPFVYEVCSIFLLPTSYEIFGMVIMEAMYYGLPVITTNNGGSSTLFNSECGIVCDLDIDKWSSSIEILLSDKVKRNCIGEKAKKIIDEKCSWDVIVKDMLDRYPILEK